MTDFSDRSKPADLSDYYLLLLLGVLLGYAFLGKGFAYLGLPPIFIGEIAFFTGVVILLRTGCLIAALTTLPSLVLVAAMAWVVLRTLPFVGVYGFDALRDSVVIMYGGFAFIVIALLLEDARRINTIVRYYGAFVNIYIPVIPFLFGFNHHLADSIPHMPGTTVPLIWIGSGEVAVHLAGAAVFVLVGFRKATLLWIVFLAAALAMVSALTRGGMLAFVVPVTFAVLTLGKIRELAAILLTGLVILAAAYSLESIFTEHTEARSSEERSISARQLVENVASIGGRAGEQTEGTKEWRVAWWGIIVNDTLYGPNFWTGRGFGLNLADADGFRAEHDLPALRSPHNVHMTLLARAGVPGVVLWLLLLASWFGMLVNAVLTARRRGQTGWAGLFLFIGCYVMSIIINATFDVALEGPMQGVWFWCLIGFGIASVMVYRVQALSVLPNRAVLFGSKRVTAPAQEAP
ncbi:O-antigen ligase family protein [Bradyrhizobium australiense]|uniref:O-antigen ligase family protein n=1 Tax=Bradyrhizobium australiense TaxID=2721161 RepID=A0A7Y4LZ11_9BRAD|nr:O-antigen ligase family protein [Bradyrhizobium australiense]NOJ43320.1 O-antigen ligase family protein [Bradyrhizobium australiense]